MPGSGVSTPAVFAAGAGALVLWSALKGASVTGGLRSLLTGHQPGTANTEPITGPVAAAGGAAGAAGGAAGGAAATGSVIADTALSYVGSGSVYRWGGGTPAGWDCSGFCNYVVGTDLAQAIPGSRSGRYSGHGPVTGMWAVFGAGVSRGQLEPGDLVIWPLFHMGIYIGGGRMVAAPGPDGTPAPVTGSIDGTGIPGPRVFRRLVFANAGGRP